MHNDEFPGFDVSPHREVQQAFKAIAAHEMQGLPFVHSQMDVYATPFTLFENQWLGCVLTPWMLSLHIYPGPQQCWPVRRVSERLGLQLPYGEMTFTVGELPALGQYLSCSLMSPLTPDLSPQQGVQLADNCLKMALSLPVTDASLSRRALLFGQRGAQHA